MGISPGSDEFTRRAWESEWQESVAGVSYDPASSPMLADSLEILKASARTDRGRFLEAGCGAAATAYNLARDGWDVAGVDMAPTAIATARATFDEAGLEGDFREGDVRAIPWVDNSFDL